MQSALMALVFLFLLSCSVKAPETSDSASPGDERSYNPIIVAQNSDLHSSLLNVCGALEEKGRNLEDYVGREELLASYQESDCAGSFSPVTKQNVMIYQRNGRYEFQNGTLSFGLPEVETLDSGVMKEICANVNAVKLENPLLTGAQSVIEFKTAETSFCRNDSQTVCLQLIRGRLAGDRRKYSVTENTLISFNIDRGGRTGFFTYKNAKTFGTCAGRSYRTKIVSF